MSRAALCGARVAFSPLCRGAGDGQRCGAVLVPVPVSVSVPVPVASWRRRLQRRSGRPAPRGAEHQRSGQGSASAERAARLFDFIFV